MDPQWDEYAAGHVQRSLDWAAGDGVKELVPGACHPLIWVGQVFLVRPILLPSLKEPGPGHLPTSQRRSLVSSCHLAGLGGGDGGSSQKLEPFRTG